MIRRRPLGARGGHYTVPVEPRTVHCHDCGAHPMTPCRDSHGAPQEVAHAVRAQLAFGLTNPESGFMRAEADAYRAEYPAVCVSLVVCTPSRHQVLWARMWGLEWVYDQEAYEAEHGPDNSLVIMGELMPGPPVVTEPATDDSDLMSASELLAKMTMKEPVKQRRKGKS